MYADRETTSPSSKTGPPAKKVALDNRSASAVRSPSLLTPVDSTVAVDVAAVDNGSQRPRSGTSASQHEKPRADPKRTTFQHSSLDLGSHAMPPQSTTTSGMNQLQSTLDGMAHAHEMSRDTTQSGPEEEAVVYMHPRMLQDPTGRLLYVGDSASLSFLQLIRMMVESVAGPSPFTTDPHRHKLVESQFSLAPDTRLTHLLPDKDTAKTLVDAFFVNTQGLVLVFDRQKFLNSLDTCYSDPLSVDVPWLCHFNLVCAIGLMLAHPRSDSQEYKTIERLRSDRQDRAELFYFGAKSLHDPITGFEDADFWSVQALLLMAMYMLSKSRRNTAFAYIGMAVRSAYSLGLHKEETLTIFTESEQNIRRNVWKSLFVLDRFVSCQLGRPTAISEEECSGDALRPQYPVTEMDMNGLNTPQPGVTDLTEIGNAALDAAVRSCSTIGIILKRVYHQRKISTRLAQEIADICKMWSKALAPMLHWTKALSASDPQGIAILHVNLLYCHSIILLTRPFFLFILNRETQRQQDQDPAIYRRQQRNPSGRMEKFSEACVVASTHTVLLVQNAFEAGYLPRRNPIVVYFLFAAALVVLSNEFAGLYAHALADQCISNAIRLMSYCAEFDAQPARLVYILTAYRNVVLQQRERWQQAMRRPTSNIISPSHHRKFSIESFGQPPMQAGVRRQPSLDNANRHPITSPTPQDNSNRATSASGAAHRDSFSATSGGPPQVLSPTSFSPSGTFQFSSSQPPTTTPAAPGVPQIAQMPPLVSESPTVSNLPVPNIMDPSGLESTLPLLAHEDSSGGEEQIDFDAFWNWGTTSPALGSPRYPGDVAGGITDSVIPLFGVLDS